MAAVFGLLYLAILSQFAAPDDSWVAGA